jgi:hypothetical protein
MDFDEIPDAVEEQEQQQQQQEEEEESQPQQAVMVVDDEADFNDYEYSAPPPVSEPEPFLPDPDPIEEDALTIFNKEWAQKLDAKREQEFQHDKAARQKASEELANWKTQREVRLNAKMDKNRTEEAVTIETLDAESGNAKPWDRLPKLIDSNEAAPSEGTKDVSRMRKLFIHLKNEPLEETRAAAL